MKYIKHIFVFILTASLLAFGAVMLCSCQSDDDNIRENLSSELDQIKELDDEMLSNVITLFGADDLTSYGIDPEEFIKSYLDGFDYAITSVDVDEDKAAVTVVLTCKSYQEFKDSFNTEVLALADDESLQDASDQELDQQIGSVAMSVVEDMSAAERDPITLDYTLNDNTWVPTADTQESIFEILFSV